MDSESEWEEAALLKRVVKRAGLQVPGPREKAPTKAPKTKGHSSSHQLASQCVQLVDKHAQFNGLPQYKPIAERHRWHWSPGGWGSGPLRVASDCAGWESFLYAMKSVGFGPQDLSLQFCSDKDPHCLTFLRCVHNPKTHVY